MASLIVVIFSDILIYNLTILPMDMHMIMEYELLLRSNVHNTYLYHRSNESINEPGIFIHDELNIAKVFPIYKSDNEQSVKTYNRPTSVLPTQSSIIIV